MYLCIYVGCSMKSNTLIERNIDETNTLCRNYFVFGKEKKKRKKIPFPISWDLQMRNLSHRSFEIL